MHPMVDCNFDPMVERFEKRIYGGLKGSVRMAVLQADFSSNVDNINGASVVDLGGGFGQFGCWLASHGAHVLHCDISSQMQQRAQQIVHDAGLIDRFEFHLGPAQELAGEFDIVLVHALLEWMAEPHAMLPKLLRLAAPGALCSVLVYLRPALALRKLKRGDFTAVENQWFGGDGVGLTPYHTFNLFSLSEELSAHGFDVLSMSGVRVFCDELTDSAKKKLSEEETIRMELQFRQQDPYRQLARYGHLLMRRSTNA